MYPPTIYPHEIEIRPHPPEMRSTYVIFWDNIVSSQLFQSHPHFQGKMSRVIERVNKITPQCDPLQSQQSLGKSLYYQE